MCFSLQDFPTRQSAAKCINNFLTPHYRGTMCLVVFSSSRVKILARRSFGRGPCLRNPKTPWGRTEKHSKPQCKKFVTKAKAKAKARQSLQKQKALTSKEARKRGQGGEATSYFCGLPFLSQEARFKVKVKVREPCKERSASWPKINLNIVQDTSLKASSSSS